MFRLRIPGLAKDSTVTSPTVQDRLFAAINVHRVSLGLFPLQRDPTLEALANQRSEFALLDWEDSGILRHDDPDISGDRYFELLPVYGIPMWNWAGENLYLTNAADPVPGAMEGWKNSPSHAANLNGEWQKLGIGYSFRSPTGISVFATIFLS